MSEQDELLLTNDQIKVVLNMELSADQFPIFRALLKAQLAKVKQHYEQERLDKPKWLNLKELFDEIDKLEELYSVELVATGKAKRSFFATFPNLMTLRIKEK